MYKTSHPRPHQKSRHGRTFYFLLQISASSGIFDLPKIPNFVLARPIFHIIIPVDRLRSFPVLPAPHSKRWRPGVHPHSLPTCTDTAFQIKKAHTSIALSRINISSRFLPFDTAWRRIFYTLYDFYTAVPACLTSSSAGLYTTKRERVSSCSRHLLASTTISLSCFLFIVKLRKKERGFWCDFLRLLSVVQREPNLDTVEWVAIKSERDIFYTLIFSSVGCTFTPPV